MAEPIYRAPMRARDVDLPEDAGAAYGLENDLVGIGGGDDAKAARMRDRFADLPAGAFVWTQGPEGGFHLGRITGAWRRDDSPQARAVGIVHVRPVMWRQRPVGDREVPEGVARSFARGGRNFQRIHDVEGERETASLWDGD